MIPSAVLILSLPPSLLVSQQILFLCFILIVWFKILSGYLRHVVASRHELGDQLFPNRIPHLFCELRVSQNYNSTFFFSLKSKLGTCVTSEDWKFLASQRKCVTVVCVVWPNYPRDFCSIYLLHALYNEGSLPRHDQPQRVSKAQWFQSRFLLTQVSCDSSVKGAPFTLATSNNYFLHTHCVDFY